MPLVFSWLVIVGSFLFGGHLVGDIGADGSMFLYAAAAGFTTGGIVSIFYLAVEPFVRRHTPQLLIGWARLIEGRWLTRGSAVRHEPARDGG